MKPADGLTLRAICMVVVCAAVASFAAFLVKSPEWHAISNLVVAP